MYIIIAGAGEVGSHIASLLLEAKHEVAIIEQSTEIVDNVRHQLEVNSITGNAATPKVLKETEVHRADLIIAVTNNDETNMLTCFLAKELGGEVAERLKIPVYLYEAAAVSAERENLAVIRRGQYEGIKAEMGKDPARDPDIG